MPVLSPTVPKAEAHSNSTTSKAKSAFPVPTLSPLEQQCFTYGHTGSPEDVIVNRTLSTSFIAKLPDHELWMAFFDDGEGNTLALMHEKR